MTGQEREMYELIRLWHNSEIRIEWDDETEDEYVAIVDVVAFLTGVMRWEADEVWKSLKNQLYREGCEWVKSILSLSIWDSYWNEEYLTEVATTSQIYRIVQSISSPKAELLKQWMADTASYREGEMERPELVIGRGFEELVGRARLRPELEKSTLRALKDFGETLVALEELPKEGEVWKVCWPFGGIPDPVLEPIPEGNETLFGGEENEVER